jgi:hypothetical protein
LSLTEFSSGTLIPPLDEVVLDKVHDEGDGEEEGGDQGGPVYRHPHQLNNIQIDSNKKNLNQSLKGTRTQKMVKTR